MYKYIVKRVLIAIATVFILATLTFFLVKVLPGSPFQSEKLQPAVRERMVEYYGLNKSIGQQYLTYMGNLLHGNLGTSLKKPGKTVTSIIVETFPVSAKLGLIAFVFAQITGIVFGILCAQFKNKWQDYILMLVAIIGVAMPSMIIGPLLRYFLGVKLQILPVAGWGDTDQLIMPAFVLGLATIARGTRSMRASMLSITTQDYIKTARSKGLNSFEIIVHHELKNALVPIISNMGVDIASVMMGSFVVESIFLIPGLGKYFVDSVTTLDYSLIMGLTVFYGAFLVVMNLLIDILYGYIDPRIRVR